CTEKRSGPAQETPVTAATPRPAAFEPTVPNAGAPRGPAPPGMVWIPGGTFSMGAADPRAEPEGGHEGMADARPVHRVYVGGFWMDKNQVTNGAVSRSCA